MLTSLIFAAAVALTPANRAGMDAACAAAEPVLSGLLATDQDQAFIFDTRLGNLQFIARAALEGIFIDGVWSPPDPDMWSVDGLDGRPVPVTPAKPATVQAYLAAEPRSASVCRNLRRLALGRGARVGALSLEDLRRAADRHLKLESVTLDLPVLSPSGDEAIAYEQVWFNGRYNGGGLVLLRKGKDGRWVEAGYGATQVG